MPLATRANVRQVLQKHSVRRLRSRRIAASDPSVAIDQEFLEIPADVSRKAVVLGGQPSIQRVPVRAIDVDFCRQGKLTP